MPVSKHIKKGRTTRQRRKDRNIRIYTARYVNSPNRVIQEMERLRDEEEKQNNE